MRRIWELLISQRALLVAYLLCIGMAVVGSLMLPANLAFFSGIDDEPLFAWLGGVDRPGAVWWIYAFIVSMGALALTTSMCTLDALLKPALRASFLHRLPPQLVHIGVLLVLLGHLLTAVMGYKTDISLEIGQRSVLYGPYEILLRDVRSSTDEQGYYTGWEADIMILRDGIELWRDTLRPLVPLSAGDKELVFKSITLRREGGGSALIRVVRDPGGSTALTGGMLVLLGAIGIAYSRRARPGTN